MTRQTWSEPINEDEEPQPHDVNEVPIPRGSFKSEVMLRTEVPADTPDQNHREDDGTDRHVQAMEPGQHEERRAVDSGSQG